DGVDLLSAFPAVQAIWAEPDELIRPERVVGKRLEVALRVGLLQYVAWQGGVRRLRARIQRSGARVQAPPVDQDGLVIGRRHVLHLTDGRYGCRARGRIGIDSPGKDEVCRVERNTV